MKVDVLVIAMVLSAVNVIIGILDAGAGNYVGIHSAAGWSLVLMWEYIRWKEHKNDN